MTARESQAYDPFRSPAPSALIADAGVRERVVVSGSVADVAVEAWAGGPTLRITLHDGSGSIDLALLGRRRLAGVGLGSQVVAAGTVGRRRGERLILNPALWLAPPPDNEEHLRGRHRRQSSYGIEAKIPDSARKRRNAMTAQMASTTPNGHAPDRKP